MPSVRRNRSSIRRNKANPPLGGLVRQIVVSIWTFVAVHTVTFMYYTSSDHQHDAEMLLLVKLTILLNLLLHWRYFFFICLILGTRLLFAVLSVFGFAKPFLWNKALFAAFFPLVVYWGVFWLSTAVTIILVFLLFVLPLVIYNVSLRQYVVRFPRYRDSQALAQSQLCDTCCRVLRKSNLLFGSMTVLVRSKEWHPFHATLRDMKRLWHGCALCEALLASKPDEETPTTTSPLGSQARNYGTVTGPLAALEEGALYITIQLHKDSSFLKRNGLAFVIQLRTSCTALSKELTIVEGDINRQNEITEYTGSLAVASKINNWVQKCEQHELCSSPTDTFLPTRLLYVGTTNDPELRIVFGSNLESSSTPRYLALSHCWGGDLSYKLETTSIQSMTKSIDFDSLPKNFQDAVIITRNAGVSYVWIDSLCILQDSSADWATESPTMGRVYKNAHWVISATASDSSSGGCFRHRKSRPAGLNLVSSGNTGYNLSTIGPSDLCPPIKTLFDTRVEVAPLTGRGWAFQERFLSRRVVHFCSDVILFECNTLQASELHETEEPYEREPYLVLNGKILHWVHEHILNRILGRAGFNRAEIVQQAARTGIRGALDFLQELGVANYGLTEYIEFNKRWYELISAYSEGALTYPTDRLIAVSGIADLVQNKTDSIYAAGIWQEVLPEFGLLWRVKGPPGAKPSKYFAPSWSWASIGSRVGLLPNVNFADPKVKEEDVEFHARVESIHLQYNGKDVTRSRSLIDYGVLAISGPMFRLYRRKSTIYSLALSETRGFLQKQFQKKVDFFPDWIPEGSPPASIDGNPALPADEMHDELFGLHVMTLFESGISGSFVTMYGVVVRPRARTGRQDTFERLGVFLTPKWSRPVATSTSRNWTRRTIRIE